MAPYEQRPAGVGLPYHQKPNHTYSHIQTAPAPSRGHEESTERGRITAILKRPSYAQEIETMTANEKFDWTPTHGVSFAAKAREAELNASRMRKAAQEKQAEIDALENSQSTSIRSVKPAPLSQYIILKPRHNRGRGSKTLNLPELPPRALDENTPLISSHTQAGQPSKSQHNQHEKSDQGGSARPSLAGRKISRSQSRPLEPFPPLFPSAPHPAINLSPSRLTASPTAFSEFDRNTWESSSSNDFNVVNPATMPRGKKHISPGTPASEGGKSRKPTSRPSSSNSKKSDVFRDHLGTGPASKTSSLNPSHQPFLPRTTPQRVESMMGDENTPRSHARTERQHSSQKQVLEDPFNEHRSTSSKFLDAVNSYSQQLDPHQQSMHSGEYGNENPPFQHSAASQPSLYTQYSHYDQQFPYTQQSSYSQQSPYAQHQGYDQPSHEQTAHAQQPAFSSHYPSYQHQTLGQHLTNQPRAAVRMPPPAVKGTPLYDSRVAVLQSMTNEQQMRNFYSADPQSQQAFLDSRFGPQQTATPSQLSNSPSKKLPQGLLAHAHARQFSQQYAPTTSPVRDPAPYTGFGAGSSKTEMLLQNLDEVLERSKAQRDLSGESRTVLHDPVAHASSQKSSSELTDSTIKATAPSFRPSDPQTQPGTVRDPGENIIQPNEGSDPAHLSHGAGDFSTASNFNTESRHAELASHRSIDPATAEHAYRDTTRSNPCADILEFIEGGSTMLPKKSRFFPLKEAPKPISYTATGLPVPHGGFADFKTPYNVNFFGEPKDFHPGINFSQAEGNAKIHSIAQDVPKRTTSDLNKGVNWFHSPDRFGDIDLVTKDLEARAAELRLEGKSSQAATPTASFQTPRGQPLPKPIGHERASASKSGGKSSTSSSTIPKKDLMKNPSAQDAKALMSGVLANMMRYADGSVVGDPFTRWGRPAEWAVDKSKDGNKSFFGGGFEAAPQRVARDPRYQQTMTADGRATYFEDPARGKRQWGMP